MNINDRVSRKIDIYNPMKGMKFGTIIRKYSKTKKRYGDLVIGPYPELYMVKWDDGSIGRGYLPHGITLIGD